MVSSFQIEQLGSVLAVHQVRYLEARRACKRRLSRTRIHNLRVACRRLLVLLFAVKQVVGDDLPDSLGELLRSDLKFLGKVRNLQIQRQYIGKLRTFSRSKSGGSKTRKETDRILRVLEGDVKRKKRRAKVKLENHFQKTPNRVQRYELAAVSDLLRRFVQSVDPKIVEDRFDRAVQSMLRQFERRKRFASPKSPQLIHELRMVLREIRYFAEAFPARLNSILAQSCQMRVVQSCFGRAHDLRLLTLKILRLGARHRSKAARLLTETLRAHEGRLIQRGLSAISVLKLDVTAKSLLNVRQSQQRSSGSFVKNDHEADESGKTRPHTVNDGFFLAE